MELKKRLQHWMISEKQGQYVVDTVLPSIICIEVLTACLLYLSWSGL